MTTKTKPSRRNDLKRIHAKKTRNPGTNLTPRRPKKNPRTPSKDNPLLTAVKRLVSATEVSEALSVPRRTIYLMAQQKLIPHFRTGRHQYSLRFNIEEVIQALRIAQKTEPETTVTTMGKTKA